MSDDETMANQTDKTGLFRTRSRQQQNHKKVTIDETTRRKSNRKKQSRQLHKQINVDDDCN
jgi:hypothetical protein